MYLLNKYKDSYLSYFLMYNFYYFSWAIFSVLISVYLMDKGFKASDVSLVVSTSFLTSMIAQPIVGYLSDKYNQKIINLIILALAGVGGVYFMFANTFLEVIIGYSFVLTLINGTNPIIERMATTSKFQYGKIRIWGTIGFSLGSQAAGIIYDYISPSAIFICFIFTIVLTIIGLIGTVNHDLSQQDDDDRKVLKKENNNAFKVLFLNKKYLMYLLIACLFFGPTAASGTYNAALFQYRGLSVSVVSTILSIAVLIEAPLVFFSNLFMDKIANKKLMMISFTLVMIQFLSYGLNLWLPVQILFTFIAKHPAGMLFIMINLKVINTIIDTKYQATALAFVAMVKSLSSIIFQNIAGYIIDCYSYDILFFIFLGILIIGFIFVLLYKIPSGNHKRLFS